MSEWKTLDEAASYLQISTRTLRRLVKAGKVKHGRAGKSLRFKKDQLDKAVEVMGRMN